MIDTFQIYETLSQSLGPEAAKALAHVLGEVYTDLQQTATRSDVLELRSVVGELAEAQKRTEERLGTLTVRVDALTARVDELTGRVNELAEAQKRTEESLRKGFREVDRRLELLDRRFGVLGSRWGDGAEEAFRQGLLELVRDLGYRVEHYQGQDPEGFINYTPRSYDLDLLVRDGELVVAEIKSNASAADVTEFHRCVLLYEKQTGQRATKRILVAVTLQAAALERARELGIIVATDFSALDAANDSR
jgi:hypothetical protein